MSQQKRFKFWNPIQPRPVEAPAAAAVPPKERAQVEQLIANGKAGVAVDIAKGIHKRLGNAASEGLLLDAYAARIASLAERNLEVEAKALMELVQSRYPSARERLREAAAAVKACGGEIEAWLELLADPSLPAERRTAIEKEIRGAAGDPDRIARCAALPPEHPLRVAAGAVARAIEAVTSGPVTAESLTLPEVSRQSPLAPWKMVLRAMQALYANEPELCEKYLAAVEPSAAAARLVPAMRAMIGQKQTLTPMAQALVKQVGGGLAALHTTLGTVDQALDKKNHGVVLQEIGKAVSLCKEACPGLLERLKQHISVRCMLAGTNVDRVAAAMGGPSLKNAYFWRLLARAYEETPDPLAIPSACSTWEEFRRHAMHEKWFPASGPEIATLYLHMADLWQRVGEEDDHITFRFRAIFKGHQHYYAGQPPEIRALMPAAGPGDLYYLNPDALFERACKADQCSENFQRWLNWARKTPQGGARVAERWAEALPKDIPPVLELMQVAEKTNALKRAFKLMEQAERLDGLNPEVRRARLRLLISLVTRHLQQKKTHLAEPELLQIEALPQARQGDRPALAAALRWVFCTLRGEASQADAARAEVIRLLGGEVAAQIILDAVADACKLKGGVPEFASAKGPLAAALGRACALGEDTGLRIAIPQSLSNRVLRELSGKNPVADAAGLAPLGEAALRAENRELAYATSAAGLAQAPERRAEFLFLRTRALPYWAEERAVLCAAAASELARRQRNLDLLRRIGEWRDEEEISLDGDKTHVAMSTEQIDSLVQRECRERAYPAMPDYMDYPEDEDDFEGECDCPACRAEREGLPPEVSRMMEEMGPDVVLRALEEMIGGMQGRQKKRRPRRASSSDDFPF